MKKENLYYKTMFARKTVAKEISLLIFVFLFSMPRLLLEVFVRKSFGERYFSIFSAVIMAIVLFFYPIALGAVFSQGNTGTMAIIFKNLSWYIFLASFLYCCYLRQREITREPGVFDFAKFSLSNGRIHPRFYAVKIRGKEVNTRLVSILVEPAFFFLIGVGLVILQQRVGGLIIFCSFCYSLGYIAEYKRGDHFIMDKIDEMICNEELAESFVEGRKPEDTKGFEVFGQRPDDPELRRKVVDRCTRDDDDVADAK